MFKIQSQQVLYSLFNLIFLIFRILNISPNKEEKYLTSNNINYYNWKEFTRQGIEIKQQWTKLEKLNLLDDNILYKDIRIFSNEIYSKLKEFFYLPKLRKENYYLESDLNTHLQTYLFDFIYNQQDLYDHYHETTKNSKIFVKTHDLPLSNSLEKLDTILNENSSSTHIDILSKLRWYINPIEYDDHFHLNLK